MRADAPRYGKTFLDVCGDYVLFRCPTGIKNKRRVTAHAC